jgi:hypothetical protein
MKTHCAKNSSVSSGSSQRKRGAARQTQTPALRRRGFALPRMNFSGLRPAVYSCPYLWSTARQSLEMRQLWAASVAPQRIRLLHVMPPERSHILAAAGLHGASSARSIALAAVAVRPIKKHAATIVFMLGSIPAVYWKRPVYPLTARKSSIFVRRTKRSQAFDNPWFNWNFQGLGRRPCHRTATFRGRAMVKVPASLPGSSDSFCDSDL